MSNLISIIIPIYNAERTLERCLDSVLAQTHKEIEVICINDNSFDQSADILSRYKEMDPRVKVTTPTGVASDYAGSGGGVNNSNVPIEIAGRAASAGPATARNAGLDAATGRYIGFVDADDFIEANMYERLLEAMRGEKAQLANCGRVSFFPDGTEKYKEPDLKVIYKVDDADSLGRFITGVPDYIWDKLFDAEIIKSEDIRFPDGRVFGEDTVFLVKYLCHVEKAVFIKDPLYHYDAHSEGSITNTISDRWYDIFENLKDIIYYMRERMDDGDFAAVRPYLEELCIRYYDRRANAMIRHGERGFQYRYVKYSFEFLSNNFPGWKKRMKAMGGVVFPVVKTSLFLMRLYILAPEFLKSRLAERVAK